MSCLYICLYDKFEILETTCRLWVVHALILRASQEALKCLPTDPLKPSARFLIRHPLKTGVHLLPMPAARHQGFPRALALLAPAPIVSMPPEEPPAATSPGGSVLPHLGAELGLDPSGCRARRALTHPAAELGLDGGRGVEAARGGGHGVVRRLDPFLTPPTLHYAPALSARMESPSSIQSIAGLDEGYRI